MRATIEDVANKAGVSIATVSRIINNIPKSASNETIARVRTTIDELGYVPNRIAVSLKKTFTKTVGMILGDIENPFFSSVIKGAEKTLQDSGYGLILTNSNYSFEKEIELTRLLIERQVDALIISPSGQKSFAHFNLASDRGIHIVLMDNTIQEANLDCVLVDNFKASYNATKFLVELGHQRIAFISGPFNRYTASQRKNGFVAAIKEYIGEIRPKYIIEGDYSIQSGYRGILSLLDLKPRPSAVFIANNLMTVGAMRALLENGLEIAKDLSIIGFDDMEWYSIVKPPLSAIRQPAYKIGKVAAERILLRLNSIEQPPPQSIVLKTEQIIRKSTIRPS